MSSCRWPPSATDPRMCTTLRQPRRHARRRSSVIDFISNPKMPFAPQQAPGLSSGIGGRTGASCTRVTSTASSGGISTWTMSHRRLKSTLSYPCEMRWRVLMIARRSGMSSTSEESVCSAWRKDSPTISTSFHTELQESIGKIRFPRLVRAQVPEFLAGPDRIMQPLGRLQLHRASPAAGSRRGGNRDSGSGLR